MINCKIYTTWFKKLHWHANNTIQNVEASSYVSVYIVIEATADNDVTDSVKLWVTYDNDMTGNSQIHNSEVTNAMSNKTIAVVQFYVTTTA